MSYSLMEIGRLVLAGGRARIVERPQTRYLLAKARGSSKRAPL